MIRIIPTPLRCPRLTSQKVLASALSALLLVASAGIPSFTPFQATADTLKGGVVVTDESSQLPEVNEDDIKEVESGTKLEMVVATTLETGLTSSGDEFFSKVSKDYVVDGKVVIPKGTLVHGIVQETKEARRAGRNGYISTNFDYMITPDGREIPIEGKHTTQDGKVKGALKAIGRGAGFTLAGGVMGSVMVLRYGGLPAIAATEGYALAGGAAIGGVVGLASALASKGKNVMIEPGTAIQVRLQEELQLPTMEMPDASANNFALEGLKVDVLGFRIDKDPFGQMNEVTLSLNLENRTRHTFTSFDVALEDENGNQHFASPFGDTGMWFRKLGPNSKMRANITFNVDDARLQHHLIFYRQYTREPLAKIALVDTMAFKDKKEMKKALEKASR